MGMEVGMQGSAPVAEFQVRGGAGSVMVEFESLESRAAVLRGAVERMEGISRELRRSQFAEDGYIRNSATPAAAAAVEELSEAAAQLERCRLTIDEAAQDLGTAVERYREVEGQLERTDRLPLITSLSLLALGRGVAGFPERAVAETLPLRFFDEGVLKVLAGAASPGRRGLRRIEVEKSSRSGEQVYVEATAAGLLERSTVLLEEDDPGVIEVLRLDGPEGPVFVVTIPGSQAGGLTAGENPFDAYGVVESRAHQSRYVAAAVAEALRQAELEAGDAVVLVGYSQGGIHAVNAAGPIQDATGAEVRYILTAAAPAGDAEIPAGAQALHLEHVLDWVPGADGTSNPDRSNRVTMTLAGPVPGVAAEDQGLGPAHKLPVYAAGASAADASTDPSLRGSLDGLASVMGAGGAATRQLYRLSRSTPPAAAVVPKGTVGKAAGRKD
ncbi:hypothetical protein [Arthrobacter sp. 7Tela_A1]|uniref:hypothetical protein n=1 Tax=Arthrobacter sp. 7Tela_A1 TaxID=3093745 RepID=UPI003BB79CAA